MHVKICTLIQSAKFTDFIIKTGLFELNNLIFGYFRLATVKNYQPSLIRNCYQKLTIRVHRKSLLDVMFPYRFGIHLNHVDQS